MKSNDDVMTDFGAAFNAGAASKIETLNINGIEHVQVPPGCKLESMEKLMPAPQRIRACPAFFDAEGFLDYTEEFAEPGTRIFVDAANFQFFTIFDAHAPGQPAWGEHAATLALNISSEWDRFKRMNGEKLSPMELAEFIEENLTYFEGPITGAELLTMAQNLKVSLKGNLHVEHSTQAGLRHLQIKDDSTVSGQSGEKELSFPDKVKLKLRVFDQNKAYEVEVFLRYRANKDAVTFWFTIPDIAGIQEAAFDRVVDEVRERSRLKTLRGRYKNPSKF